MRTHVTDVLHIAALPLETTVPDLLEPLKQGGLIERKRAAVILGRFGPAAAEAVPSLIHALADESHFVRKVAVMALGKIGPAAKAAIPALTAIQDEEFVGCFAKKALREIAGE